MSILLVALSINGFALSFNNGSPQSLSSCISSANSINSLLTATDATGSTFTWTVTSSPTHGTLGGFPQSTASGTNVSPSSTTYTPTTGYIGTDAFTIQVSNGTTSVSTTINVVVNPTPTVTSVSPLTGNALSGVTITGTNFNTTAGNNIVYFGTTRASVTSASATSLSVTVPNEGIFAPVSVENSTCALTAYNSKPFLPTYNNSAFAPNTVNFAAQTNIAGSFQTNIGYGDIDGDGKVDMITCDGLSGSITIYRNTSTTGTPTFSLALTISTGTGTPGKPAMGDVDGDGLLDLAVSIADASGSLNIYRNTSTPGSISFAAVTTIPYPVSGTAGASAIADIDGDGRADIVSCFSSTISVFRNTGSVGSLSFAARADFAAPATINGLATGDVDGDGKTDMLAATATIVSAWQNTSTPGTVSFATRQDFTSVNTTRAVGIADIDGDGKMDIIAGGSTDLSIFNGTSTPGAISMGARTDISTSNDRNLGIGDFDGDGKPDIAVTHIPSGVDVFRNTSTSGTISFAGSARFATSATPSDLVAVDIDGDGKSDFAFSQGGVAMGILLNAPLSPNTGTATVCPGLTTTLSNSFAGGGTWTSGTPAIATVASGTGVVTGVMSGTANITFTTAGTAQNVITTVTVTATPTVTNISPVVGFPASSVTITGTNFNTTSTNDIVWFGATRATVTSASATSLTVSVPLGSVFGPVTVESSTCGLQAASTKFYLQDYSNGAYIANTVNLDNNVAFSAGAGSNPQGIAFGDFDGDGKTDIVAADFASGNVSVFLNTSTSGSITSGSFGAAVNFTVGGTPAGISVADLDGDGKLDIAVANRASVVSVLRNTSTTGSLSFSAHVDYATGGNDWDVKIADIDGDGKQDLIVSNFGSNTISIIRNTAVPGLIDATSFASQLTFATGTGPFIISVGDIDGDGKTDVIVPNRSANTVSVLRNTSTPGTVNMAGATTFGSGSSPFQTATGDIDGDGKLDILVPNSGTNSFSVYRNTSSVGSVTVTGPTNFTTPGAICTGVAIGDIDGDGKPDVVASNNNATISLYRNTATSGAINAGSFAANVNFNANSGGTTGWNAVVGDLDGDGKADIAVTASGTTVTVLRNDPLQPITGTFVVCQAGPTSTLSEAAPGGIWTSSNSAVATVGSATGVVAGITGGTAVITYQGTATALALGNYTTQTVTVNVAPSAAFTTTPNPFCIGTAAVFSNSTPAITNYLWNFDDGATSTVNGVSHTYTAAGTYTASLTVTNTNGCLGRASAIVTVNPLPAAIAGSLAVCTGTTTALSNTSPGGSWSSGSTAVGTVNAATGVVTGLTPGTTLITYTLTTGCSITATVTVNQTPAAIGGPTAVCVGSTITLTDATLPGTGVWTSGNTALGTIVSSTGVLTGISAGTTAVTYTIPATGCFNSKPVTVNALPAAITGTLAICSGLTSPLADATTGGSWSSSAPAVGSISASGVVTAVGAGPGNTTITYTAPNTCIATAQVTVNPNPAAIGGTATVCTGFSTTLTETTGGGTWSTSDPTIATVSGPTVTGVNAGIATISYSLGTGCLATKAYTVNTTPAAIGGTPVVCVGSTTTLSDATTGGTWTSSATSQATVGAGTGVVTGVGTGGTPDIIYTIPSTGCFASATITVNPLPAAIGGTTNVCVGSTTTLTESSGSSTWTSSNPTLASVGAATGIVTGNAAGTLAITFTLPTGCAVSAPFTVNPVPAAITGASSVCSGLTTTFADAVSGGTWSSAASGTASVGATGIVTGGTPGSTNIIYTLPGGCSVSKSILVNPQPAAIGGASSVCVGLTTTLTDATTPGTWSSSNTAVGTISAIGVVGGITAGTLNISYTLSAGCFSVQPFTVNPTPATVTGPAVVCVGSTITVSDVTSGGAWSSNDISKATVNSITGVVTGTGAGNPSIIYTLPAGCTAAYPITVNAVPDITSFSPSATSVCASVTSTVNVTSVSLGAGTFTVTYNLSGANTATGSTATLVMSGAGTGTFSIVSSALASPGATTVTVTQITNSFGCTSALSSGNTSSFTVYPYPTAYTVSGTGSFCSGGAGGACYLV